MGSDFIGLVRAPRRRIKTGRDDGKKARRNDLSPGGLLYFTDTPFLLQ